jgi:PhnB protein
MEERPTFAPYLVVSNGDTAIDFYKSAFGAVELVRHAAPGTDKLMHAHLVIHGGHLMLSDDFSAQMGGKSETPEALGGSPVTFHIHADSADDVWAQALAAGAEVTMPLADQFWGDRYGQWGDSCGQQWFGGETLRTSSQEEIEEGAKASFSA